MTKSLSKQKSSASTQKRHNRSSERKSLSSSIKRSDTASGTLKDVSRESSVSVEPEKPKINYQDELVLVFFNSMLDNIIEEWITISDEPPTVCACNKEDKENVTTKDFKDLSPEDLQNMQVAEVRGSALSFTKKGRSSLKSGSSKNQSRYDSATKGIKRRSADRTLTPDVSLKRSSRGSTELRKSVTSSDTNISSIQASNVSLDWFLNPANENAIIKFKNGNVYEGPVSKKLMHGLGKFIWADGAVYEGEFIYGDATGNGTLLYPDLTFYTGNFCKSFLHGEGVLNISSTTMIYSGKWKGGKKHGEGWLLYDSGNWYQGEWYEDKRQGFGLRQYKTGVKYQGGWHQGERYGQGAIVWPNNDFYKGEWFNGKMHGYGEYTWNAFLNETFTFPLENTYQGNWVNGMRDGVGIMNFGTEGGAKLAGIWEQGKKHGAGVMLCGNGAIIERDPLFWCDKPIHLETEADHGYPVVSLCAQCTCDTGIQKSTSETNPIQNKKSTLQLIVEQVQTKQENQELECHVLENIARSQENTVRSREYIPRTKSFSNESTKFYTGKGECSPLHMPIHSAPEQTDFSYYISLAVQKYTASLYKTEFLMKEVENANVCGGIKPAEGFPSTVSKYSKWNILTPEVVKSVKGSQHSSKITSQSTSDQESKLQAYQQFQSQIEEKHLRNSIITQLSKLWQVYDKYATIACLHTLTFKPILIRYFVWQMLRDWKIVSRKYTLVDFDRILADNPESGLESQHYPFEKIYFWQFLQILLALAWLLHSEDVVTEDCKRFGILSAIFTKFLTDTVYKNVEITFACSIFGYRDVLPIQSVYQLYQKLGEPHSARHFLCSTCTKKHEDPPCYLKIFRDEKTPTPIEGMNVVPVGGNIVFLPRDPPDIGEKPNEHYPDPPMDDPFRKDLFVLRCLGPKRVTECLVNVCPLIADEGVIVNMDYPLTFIEFYETLLLCAFMVVDRNKKREERARLRAERNEITNNFVGSKTTIDSKSGKERKKSKTK